MARGAAMWDAGKMSTLEMSAKGMTKQSNSSIQYSLRAAVSIHKPNCLNHWLFPATTVEAQQICGCLIDTTCMDYG
jgi:hypothetical protein